jgi:hypothetical protein
MRLKRGRELLKNELEEYSNDWRKKDYKRSHRWY